MKNYKEELKHKFNTESFFDEFVKSNNGILIKETLDGNPQFENADYLFDDEKVIIELKSLQSDFAEITKLSQKVEKELTKWVQDGEINIRALYNWDFMTNRHKTKLFQIKYEPIRRTLKKANSQIKSTKNYLKIETQGVVVLVIDGVKSVEFNELFSAIANLLDKENFSCIDGFVLMTMNTYVDLGNGLANQLWAPAYAQENNKNLSNFVNHLGERWGYFLQKKVGRFEHASIKTDDFEILRNTKHI